MRAARRGPWRFRRAATWAGLVARLAGTLVALLLSGLRVSIVTAAPASAHAALISVTPPARISALDEEVMTQQVTVH